MSWYFGLRFRATWKKAFPDLWVISRPYRNIMPKRAIKGAGFARLYPYAQTPI